MSLHDESTRWHLADVGAALVLLLTAGAVVYVMAERFSPMVNQVPSVRGQIPCAELNDPVSVLG